MKKFLTLIAVAFMSVVSFAQHAEWTAAQLPQTLFADKAAAEAAGFNTLWWTANSKTADWLGMPAQDLIKTDWVTVSLATPYSYVSKGNGKYSGKAYAYKLIMGMNNSTRDGIDPLFFLEGVQNNDYVRKTGDSDQGNVVNDAIIKIVTEKTPYGVDPWTYSVTMRINRANNAAAFYVVDATKSKMVVQTMTRNHESFVGDNVIRFNIEQGHEYYCMASEKGSVELYSITVDDPTSDFFEVEATEANTTALWTADMLPTTKFATVDEAVAAGFNTLWGYGDYLGMPAQDLIKNDEVTVSLANPYNAVYAVNKIGGGKKHTYKLIMGMNNSTRDGIDPLYFLEGVQNNDYVRKTGDSDQGNVVNDAILKIEVAPNAEGTDPYCSRMIFNYSRGNNYGAFYVVDATKSIPVYQDVTRINNTIEKKQSAIINVYPGRTYYVIASDRNSVELYNVGYCSAASEKYLNFNATHSGVPVISVSLDKSFVEIPHGSSFTLNATISPDSATYKNVKWTTSNANVATVDNGVVKAVGVGTTTITAQVGSKTATCEVTVYEIPVTSVTLDKSETVIEAGKSFTLTATVLPDSATFKNVIWSTSNSSVAIVDNGVVKAVGVGTATIKAIAGGKTAECVVTVEPDYTVVSTTAESSAPGILKALAVSELKNIVSLKINGTINSYDLIVLNNKMPNLQYLDLENARIVACDYEYRTGYKTEDDVIGTQMFYDQDKYKFIKLPLTITRIDNYAFGYCDGLTSMVIPNAVTTIGYSAFEWCNNMSSVVIPKSVSRIEDYAFQSCPLTSVDIPSSVRYIGGCAFRYCPLQEVTIPSSVREIGWAAFEECRNLNKVYTRTVEPTSINQNTFSVYSTATLYVPKTSYNLYWMDTEWSQFANLVEYDAPYDSFYVSNDYILDDETGNVQGTPDVELEPGSGLVHEGSADQNLGDVHVNANGDVSASIIGNGNVNIENLYLDITINANKWFFFSFPYKIMLDKIQHPGEYVWRRYDGEKRAANGRGGWSDIVTDCLNQGEGYIYQTNKDGVMSVRVLKEEFGKLEGKDIDVDLKAYASSSANNASWNLLGNPFISYYDIEDLGYDAPITIWNGNSYVAMRPGDDDYILRPFEAFFVQKTKDATSLKFKGDRRKTYKQAKDKAKKVRMTGIDKQRFIVNLVISDGENSDKTRVVFNEKQNNAYEIGCDAAKFMSTESVPQLYTLDSKNVKYSINERPEGEVAMGYVANKEGQYTISAVRMDKAVMIKDLERGVIHDLSTGDYTFASEAGTFEGRFVLMLNSDVTGIDDIKSQTGVEVAVVNGGISISGAAGKTVTIYNVGGAQVAANVTDGVVALASGTYIVTVDGVSTKVIVL